MFSTHISKTSSLKSSNWWIGALPGNKYLWRHQRTKRR